MSEEKKNPQYQIQKADGYTMIRLIGELSSETAKQIEAEIPTILTEPFTHVIVNCDYLSGMPKAWVRALLTLERELKKVNKGIRFMLVPPTIKNLFKAEGVDKPFQISLNLRDAQVQLGLVTKKQMDADFINPFLNATLNVLKIQTKTEATPGKIYVKTEKNNFTGDISGVIGLVSESFNGSVVISFPEQTFLKVMSRMLEEEFTSLTKEISDGAGELTNMIFGQAKIVLNEKGYGIKTALPSVVTGKDHTVSSLTSGPIVVIPFETDVGAFFVEVCLSA